MKEKLSVGLIGLGRRGMGILKDILLPICETDIVITAVCDLHTDRMAEAADRIVAHGDVRPHLAADYHEMLTEDIDAVLILSDWQTHVEMACEAMLAGKAVGMEVGASYSMEECWRLVRTSESTGKPCMMLENCCYGQRELMLLNMVKQGVFGDILYCEGGYHHDLRDMSLDSSTRQYRLLDYLKRNCENYPTHELGPICRLLNINRGNRLLTVSSVSSCAKGFHTYLCEHAGQGDTLASADFRQGDIVRTTIRCAGGQTISLTLDTTLPCAYSRGLRVIGTRAQYCEDADTLYTAQPQPDGTVAWQPSPGVEDTYRHPLWRQYAGKSDRDGMNDMVFRAFLSAVADGRIPPIDVYDTATWMCIANLSEESIAMGGAPRAIPDFTGGRWRDRSLEGEPL